MNSRRLISQSVAVAVLAVLAFPASSVATAPAPARYVLKRGHKCRAHYVRRHAVVRVRRHGHWVRVGRVECVHVKAHTTPATMPATPAVKYSARVDPTFTQSASNPLAVTYDYTAGAFANNVNLAAAGQLPAGVLNLFSATSPGQPAGLVCSMNVGGAVTGSTCPVTYSTPGVYAVTTEYVPNGVTAVTQTDSETIRPYGTTTTAAAAMTLTSCNAPQALDPSASSYSCDYTITASTSDQNGNPVAQPITLRFSPVGFTFPPGESYDITVTMPAGNTSCALVISEATSDGNQRTGGTDPHWSSAIFPVNEPNNCYGGGGAVEPGPAPTGIAVASWTMVASFGGTPGWTASSSTVQTITPQW